MRRIITVIKDFGLLLIGSMVAGIVSGFLVFFAVSSLVQKPFTSLCVGLLFVPFHLDDMKRFWIDRRIHLIAARYVTLTLIASGIFGLLRFGFGFGDFDIVSLIAMATAIPLGFFIAFVFYFVRFFLRDHWLGKNIEERWIRFVDGAKTLDLWWDY
ncbi:MAG: hypothetical protein IPO41_06640 [Acidobacteria bacterium]|nr:hypothetical protein [Acidobacteriota bacterium]MBP7473941.1 hypothetical protein [Pyrinomonadaceae bacterium]MBP9109185.1 hypothetical protein [Pyrinomonadaceae bacterium]